MLLVIDAGNTNIVFAFFEGKTLKHQWRCETSAGPLQLKAPPGKVSGAIIASVVPKATPMLVDFCEKKYGCKPLVVGNTDVHSGIGILVDHPQEVGADRIVNAVAAASLYEPPLIVVDFGTATTFDVVDEKGNYRGGVIAPGANLSMKALHLAAAKLPQIDIKKPKKIVGTNTVDCMQAGLYWGYVSLTEGVIRRIREEYGQNLRVVATGGLSGLIAQDVGAIEHVDADLTLKGLRIIYERNT